MMKLPLTSTATKAEAESLAKQMSKLVLSDILERITVKETFSAYDHASEMRSKDITIKLSLWPQAVYQEEFRVDADKIAYMFEKRFIVLLEQAIAKEMKGRLRKDIQELSTEEESIGVGTKMASFEESQKSRANSDDEGESAEKKGKKAAQEADSDNEDDASSDVEADGDATDAKLNRNRKQEASYDAPDEDDQEVIKEIDEQTEDKDDDEDEDASKNEDDAAQAGRIVQSSKYVTKFSFNREKSICELTMRFPADTKKLLMVSIVESVAKKCVIREVKGLTRAFVMENEAENDTSVRFRFFYFI